jgi:hypothetical protein
MKNYCFKWQRTPGTFFIIAALCWSVAGCATKKASHANSGNGYVDFFTDEGSLEWKVYKVENGGKPKTVFERHAQLDQRGLRLEFAPGHHRFQVTFLNRVIAKPAEVDVEVLAGRVTPVHVTFGKAVTSAVIATPTLNSTMVDPAGRRIDLEDNETITYELRASAASPVIFQPMDRMVYAHNSFP